MSSAVVPTENDDHESSQPNSSQSLLDEDTDQPVAPQAHTYPDSDQPIGRDHHQPHVDNDQDDAVAISASPQPIANADGEPPVDAERPVPPPPPHPVGNIAQGQETNTETRELLPEGESLPAHLPGRGQSTKPRSRSSYSKRYLVSPDDFWIYPNFHEEFCRRFRRNPTNRPINLVGKIAECPRKKNGNVYSIVWDNSTLSSLEVPQNWIKSQFTSNSTVKDKLRQCIQEYNPSQHGRGNQPSQTQQSQQTSQLQTHQPYQTSVVENQQNNYMNNNNAQPPVVQRRGSTQQPPPPSTAERARHRAAIRNVPESSLRRSPRRHSRRSSTSNPPSTQERAQGRAALMTALNGGPSPSENGNDENNDTPTTQVPTRLFGSTSTSVSTRASAAARRQRRQEENTEDDASENGEDSSSDEDDNGGYELDFNATVDRNVDPLDDYDDNDDNNEDEENVVQSDDSESTDDDDDPNNSTNLKVLIDNLQWHYRTVDQSDSVFDWVGQERHHRSMFRGSDGLKAGVANSFNTPFDCLRNVGGLSKSLISDMAAATNRYFHQKIRPKLMGRRGYFHSQKWKDVTIQEMTRFLGIILMMSLRPLDSGGYASYFNTSNRMYSLGTAIPSVEILDSTGWASKYMRLARFRQIRGAFHPESKGAARGGDKCYQLRKLIQAVNAASKRSFIIPQDLSFDEGGIGCRSRYCPVRQYNKDKPAKFRVDFFILASSTSSAILHMDVYQGKNATNSYIRHEARRLPTTMKTVVNACYALELNKETNGFRHLSMDNRYAAPQLLVILRDRLKVLATGTVRVNRVGWSKSLMNLKKTKTNRGTMKLAHDKVNGVIIGQWVDSKVVNFVSTYENIGTGQVRRQVGPNKESFNCPQMLIRYQTNMGGIDNGDQMRCHMGGFATHVHFKKWYKKAGLGIMDTMLLNSFIAWNMSAGDRVRSRRTKLSRHEFYTVVAQEMCSYVHADEVDALARRTGVQRNTACEDGHYPVPIDTSKRMGCAVCLLEHRWKRKEIGMKGLFSNVGQCAKCRIVAHLVSCTDDREDGWKIHKLPQFANQTCFEILHSTHSKEMFMCRSTSGEDGRYKYTTKKNHPFIMALREKHGLSPEYTRKRRRSTGSENMQEDNEEANDNNGNENDNNDDTESNDDETTDIHEL